MSEWVTRDDLDALRELAMIEPGSEGVRDESLIQAALMRPINRSLYEETDLAELAACYLFGIAKAHGFINGNKRTAWLAARLFLALRGVTVCADPSDVVELVRGVASGKLSELGAAAWFREQGVDGPG